MKKVVLVMVLIAVASLSATGFSFAHADSGVKEIRMTAEYWRFTPSTISVELGERVRFIITVVNNMMPMMKEQFSRHGFYVEGYDVSAVLPVGDTVKVEFVADKEGAFKFFCTIYCGMGHDTMRGTLLVGKDAQASGPEPSRPGMANMVGMMRGMDMMGMMSGMMGGMGGGMMGSGMMGGQGMMNMTGMMGGMMPGGMGGMMPWGGWGPWGWGFGFLWMLLSLSIVVGLLALLIIGAYYMFRKATAEASPKAGSPKALEILDERFARGEINKKEYEEMKRALSSR